MQLVDIGSKEWQYTAYKLLQPERVRILQVITNALELHTISIN